MALSGVLRDLTLALGAVVAILGSLLFIAWKIYFRGTDTGTNWSGWWERDLQELRDRVPPGDALDWWQVLVLDGVGKSRVLHNICSQMSRERIAPTHSFSSAQLFVEGLQMDLLEVGGSQNLRSYWHHYLSHAHVLVFLVDSVDRSCLLMACQELHALLAAEPQLPCLHSCPWGCSQQNCPCPGPQGETWIPKIHQLLQNDKSNALSTAELREELALHMLSEEWELFLLPTSATWASLSTATSVLHMKNLLVTLLSQP